MGVPPITLGVLNALVNAVIWIITSLCAFATERIYTRVSSYDLARRGYTRSTDATEVLPNAWLFGHLYSRYRRSPVWWALILLFLNFALLPLEILLEGGIESMNRCAPYSTISRGVCASPYDGHSESGISAAMLATQRFTWADKKWDYVLVGSSKIPQSNEVRVNANLLKKNRSYLVRDCVVQTSSCPNRGPCGTLIVKRTDGPYDTMVDNVNTPKEVYSRGDLTYDRSLGTAFHFWEAGSSRFRHNSQYSRKIIKAEGVETILNQAEINRVLNRQLKSNWKLLLNRTVTRRYRISCITDGLLSKDLAKAISLFRTSQLEQPGVRHTDVNYNISNLAPLDASNVAMAAYAMKSEDWNDPCTGEIDVYRTCGTFKPSFVLPFLCLAIVIVMAWIFVTSFIRQVGNRVPVDTVTWRKHALRAIRGTSGTSRSPGMDDRTVNSEDMFTSGTCFQGDATTRSLQEFRRREADELMVIQADSPMPPGMPRAPMPPPIARSPVPVSTNSVGLGVPEQQFEYSIPRYLP